MFGPYSIGNPRCALFLLPAGCGAGAFAFVLSAVPAVQSRCRTGARSQRAILQTASSFVDCAACPRCRGRSWRRTSKGQRGAEGRGQRAEQSPVPSSSGVPPPLTRSHHVHCILISVCTDGRRERTRHQQRRTATSTQTTTASPPGQTEERGRETTAALSPLTPWIRDARDAAPCTAPQQRRHRRRRSTRTDTAASTCICIPPRLPRRPARAAGCRPRCRSRRHMPT